MIILINKNTLGFKAFDRKLDNVGVGDTNPIDIMMPFDALLILVSPLLRLNMMLGSQTDLESIIIKCRF